MIQCDYSAAAQYVHRLWMSASVVETPTTSSINSALNFIIARWRPGEAWKKVFWVTLLLHLQHRLWVLHRELPTFVFHISQRVWLGPPSHSVVVLYDCRLSHTQLIVSSKSHEEGALWLWEALKIQLLLFKRVSQRGDSIVQSVTPGQKHFFQSCKFIFCTIMYNREELQ